MYPLLLALVTPWLGAAPPSSPVIAPLDQASDTVIVGAVHPGARVDIYANAMWAGAAVARGTVVAIHPARPLEPGAVVVAVERMGAYANYSVRPQVVSNDYVTFHYDDQRTGWNSHEAALTQSAVQSGHFGQLFSTSVDGNVEAQPLELSGVAIPGQGTHDVVYAVTENDSAYALDAATGQVLWMQNYVDGANGFAPVQESDESCPFIQPVIGITGTPVIDRASGTMYFDAFERQTQGTNVTFHHFLHAVDVTTGLDQPGSPVEIRASLMAPSEGMVTFDAQAQLQRPGLLLLNGVVYVGYGSFCDRMQRQTHGWILAYDASTLKQVAVFNASLSTKRGLSSFWAGGFGLAADQADLFVTTGNGDYDGNTGGVRWGDSILHLSPALQVRDYFTPFNQDALNAQDLDLGGGGTMLLPPQAGAFPSLLVVEGKYPTVYLTDRKNLGGYTPGGPDHVVQELVNVVGPNHGIKGGPSYYVSPSGQPVVFYSGGDDRLKAFALETSPNTQLVLIDKTAQTFHGQGGADEMVTSNGQKAGSPIVWLVQRPRPTDMHVWLVAFAADDLQRRLTDLQAGPWLNPQGGFFAMPTAINGRVFVGSANAVTGFGLR